MEKGSILESMKENREWANDPSEQEAILKGFENVLNHQSHQNSLAYQGMLEFGNGSGMNHDKADIQNPFALSLMLNSETMARQAGLHSHLVTQLH